MNCFFLCFFASFKWVNGGKRERINDGVAGKWEVLLSLYSIYNILFALHFTIRYDTSYKEKQRPVLVRMCPDAVGG